MVLDTETIFDTAKEGADEFFIQEAEQALQPRLTIKEADQTVSNQTLVDDNELLMPLSAQQTYDFELFVGWDSSNSGTEKLKYTFTIPTGTIGNFYRVFEDGEPSELDVLDIEDTAQTSGFDENQTKWDQIKGFIKTGNETGNLQFRFAEDQTGTGGVTIKAGSSIKVTRQ